MRSIATIITAFLLFAGPVWAQEADASQTDPNLRTPQIYEVELENGNVSAWVVGEAAYGDVVNTILGLHLADAEQDQLIQDQLWQRRDTNSPVFLYEITRRAVASNPERALEAYFLARSRILYDAARCVDSSAMGVVDAASEYVGDELVNLINSDMVMVERVLSNLAESGEMFTSQASPWYACSFGDAAYFAATNGVSLPGAEWLKTEVRWQDARDSVEYNIRGTLAVIQAGLESAEAE